MAQNIANGKVATSFSPRISFLSLSFDWHRIIWPGVVIVVVLAIILIPMVFGWSWTVGRSMEPTLSFIALIHNDTARSPEVGDIIRFDAPNDGTLCVKRVSEVFSDGSLWVSADNKGWTGEDSDNYGPVPLENVHAVADDIWTPFRLWRSRAREGRFQNWVDFRWPPSQQKWSTSRQTVAVIDGKRALLLLVGGRWVLPGEPFQVHWEEEKLVYDQQIRHEGVSYIERSYALPPGFELKREAPRQYAVADGLTGYEPATVIEFFEIAAGETKEARVQEGDKLYLSSPGPVRVEIDGIVGTFSPGEEGIREVETSGKVYVSIPNEPPFDVPMGDGSRVWFMVLRPIVLT